MKKLIFSLAAVLVLSCTPKVSDLASESAIMVDIDLINVTDDKVVVQVDPGRFTSETVNFYIPKTVPGTYSNDNYGKFIEDLQALDYHDNPLAIVSVDENTWKIENATQLDKITYSVNDSFDTETQYEDAVFSPAGSNIEEGENYFMNMHMFVGYFDNLEERPYQIRIAHEQSMSGSTSLKKIETTSDNPNTDTYIANRYFEVTDNPIMYSRADSETFSVNDITVTLSVYSPNKVYSALSISEEMEEMMKAQKAFLGPINSTNSYHILLFLGSMQPGSPTGFGALEHHTSTTVVLPETMPKEALVKTMTDVVSHEFFHIVTPLTVHSEEIQDFDYNDPQMSQHLWMYEGVTEYFANLFQINQGLIDNQDFYDRMGEKIENSRNYNDSTSFTRISKNILVEPYKKEFANVYEKGALIGMCLDIIIREQSQGEKGILWLMKELSNEYGMDKPFKDDELFDKIVTLTYPEVKTFIEKHIKGGEPIDYNTFFEKVGLESSTVLEPTMFFIHGQIPFIDVNPQTKAIFVRNTTINSSMNALGLQSGDIIKEVNGTEFTLESIQNVIMQSMAWQADSEINLTVERDGEELELHGTLGTPVIESGKIQETKDATQVQKDLRHSWLKE